MKLLQNCWRVEHAPRLSTFRTSNADVQQKEKRIGISGDPIYMADKGNKFRKHNHRGRKRVLLVRSTNTTAVFWMEIPTPAPKGGGGNRAYRGKGKVILEVFFLAARALSIMSPFLKVKLWIKIYTRKLTSFVALWMRSEGSAPKKWRTNSYFLLYNAPAHRSVLDKY